MFRTKEGCRGSELNLSDFINKAKNAEILQKLYFLLKSEAILSLIFISIKIFLQLTLEGKKFRFTSVIFVHFICFLD